MTWASAAPEPTDLSKACRIGGSRYLLLPERRRWGRIPEMQDPRQGPMADKQREIDETVHYDGPSGGWGSFRGIGRIFGAELDKPDVLGTLMRQNKPGGLMCVSCAWTKPAEHHPFEFCENGAKATLWELTTRRCTPEFFSEHTVSELRGWKD